MDKRLFLNTLKKHKTDFENILSRFQDYQINNADTHVYQQKIQEVTAFLNDNLVDNPYSARIDHLFNEGITNSTGSPSHRSVTNIISVIGVVITRVSRNPELLQTSCDSEPLDQPSYTQQPQATNINYQNHYTPKYTDKVTFGWLLKNAPVLLWIKLLGLLAFTFILGVVAAGVLVVPPPPSHHIPGNKVDTITPPRHKPSPKPNPLTKTQLSPQAHNGIKLQITKLSNAHNETLSLLKHQLLEEERLSKDQNLAAAEINTHKEAAQLIRKSIEEEKGIFQKKLKHLKGALKN